MVVTPPKTKEPEKKDPPKETKPQGTGVLNVACKPAAKVFIDGKDTGRYTPLLNHKLPAGPHTLRLINTAAGINQTYRVTIKPGAAKTVVHRPK